MEQQYDPEPTDALDSEREFREQQRRGIGATDTPKILGLSKYGTARTVYERLLSDPSEASPSSLPAWVGLRIQGTVAELYTAATGYRLRAANQHYKHKEDEWLVCHLDYRVWGSPHILVECKTRSRMRGWGDDGSEVVPPDVWAQCQHEMLVTGATECHVAVLFGHHTFRVYPLKRNEEFITSLRPILRDFWHDFVLAKVPPPLTGHPADARIVAEEHPDNDAFYRNATPAQTQSVAALKAAADEEAAAAFKLEGAKNRVKDIIGDAMGLIGPFGRVTWKRTKDATIIDWQSVAKAYRRIIEDPTVYEDLDVLEGVHTNIREGYRRFTMEWDD